MVAGTPRNPQSPRYRAVRSSLLLQASVFDLIKDNKSAYGWDASAERGVSAYKYQVRRRGERESEGRREGEDLLKILPVKTWGIPLHTSLLNEVLQDSASSISPRVVRPHPYPSYLALTHPCLALSLPICSLLFLSPSFTCCVPDMLFATIYHDYIHCHDCILLVLFCHCIKAAAAHANAFVSNAAVANIIPH